MINSSLVPFLDYPEEYLKKIDNIMLYSVENGLPGGLISLSIAGKKIFQKAYGYQRLYNQCSVMKHPEKMTDHTIFDTASLTKIFSTLLAYAKLLEEKKISIQDPVYRFIPEYKGFGRDKVTIQNLLKHDSGLPASYPFYDPSKAYPGFYSQNREQTIEVIKKVPLEVPAGTRTLYSDLGFMMLGVILEKITEQRQDIFVSENIYEPLGLKNTGYNLLKKYSVHQFEATERCGNTREGNVYFPNVRTETIQGEVQDEKCFYSMGGVAGHAGLFSDADDLTVLCQLVLNKGSYGFYQLCSPSTMDLFLPSPNEKDTFSLGFQIPSADTKSIYGFLYAPIGQAVGHTGWTGKCFKLDFLHQSIVLVLTNKKHSPLLKSKNHESHEQDFNQFEADILPAPSYGSVIQLFDAGFLV